MTSLSCHDEYGFVRAPDFDYPVQEDFLSSYLAVLARRAARWDQLLGKDKAFSALHKGAKLKRFVRKGVPSAHRKGVWLEVSGAAALRRARPQLYQEMLAAAPPSEVVVGQIVTDLPRTFPNNSNFDSTKSDNLQGGLYRVLLAFSNNNPAIGYCQGLNYIAGLLLLVTREEEAAFWLLKVLLEHQLPDYYTPSMPGLLTDLRVLELLVKQELPALARHIEGLGAPWALLASKWFICLYSEVLPTETVLRVWDIVFYEGSKILFRVAIGLLKINQEELLAKTSFADLVEGLKTIVVSRSTVNCHTFLEEVLGGTGSLPRAHIHQLREEQGRLVRREQGEREASRREQGGLKEG